MKITMGKLRTAIRESLSDTSLYAKKAKLVRDSLRSLEQAQNLEIRTTQQLDPDLEQVMEVVRGYWAAVDAMVSWEESS